VFLEARFSDLLFLEQAFSIVVSRLREDLLAETEIRVDTLYAVKTRKTRVVQRKGTPHLAPRGGKPRVARSLPEWFPLKKTAKSRGSLRTLAQARDSPGCPALSRAFPAPSRRG